MRARRALFISISLFIFLFISLFIFLFISLTRQSRNQTVTRLQASFRRHSRSRDSVFVPVR
jgi:hypothetical protein